MTWPPRSLKPAGLQRPMLIEPKAMAQLTGLLEVENLIRLGFLVENLIILDFLFLKNYVWLDPYI